MEPHDPKRQDPKPPRDLPRDAGTSYRPEDFDQTMFLDRGRRDLRPSQWDVQGTNSSQDDSVFPQPDAPANAAFILERMIAEGGCGEVWEATQMALGRIVAVKRLKPHRYDLAEEPRAAELLEFEFRQEASITACLEHPNIVPVHDLGVDHKGRPLLAMKRVRGKPWSDLIKSDRGMPVAEFLARHVTVLIQVAQAVAFAHSRGILHRDLKPSQVMVGEFGEVLLMDWGLAVLFDEDAARLSGAALPLRLAPIRELAPSPSGTPAYMAPEQTFDNARDLGPWTDVFLLGGILFYLLTDTVPNEADDAEGSFRRAATRPIESAHIRAPRREIPVELAAIAEKCLRPNPRDRVASVAELIRQLNDHLAGSTKRRESQALSRQARQGLLVVSARYRDHAELQTLLSKAQGLWPENPELPGLRRDVAERYARTAIGHGDLVLARVQADSLEDEPTREKLLAEIGELERAAARREQQRHWALRGIGALGVLLLGASIIVLVLRLEAERESNRAALLRRDAALADERANRAERERALTEERVELFERLASFRAAEAALRTRAARALPLPTRNELRSQLRGLAAGEAESLIDDIEALRRERAALAPQAAELVGEEPIELTLAAANLGLARASELADFDRAYAAYEAIAERIPEAPEPLLGMGLAALSADHMTSATRVLARAAERAREEYGTRDPRYADALAMQGDAAQMLDSGSDPAERYYRESLAILEPQWAELGSTIAERLGDLGELRRSIEFSTATLELRDPTVEPGMRDARLFMTASRRSSDVGAAAQAAEFAHEGIRVAREAADATPLDLALLLVRAADNFERMGRYDEAQSSVSEALGLLEGMTGPEASRIRVAANSTLADLTMRQGNAAEAERLYREVLANDEAGVGRNQNAVAGTMSNLAVAVRRQGRFEEATQLLEQSVKRLEATLPPDHPDLAGAYATLAGSYGDLERWDECIEYTERAIAMLEKASGEGALPAVRLLPNLAYAYRQVDRTQEAETLYKRAIDRISATYGPRNPEMFVPLVGIAELYRGEGRVDDAINANRRALDVALDAYGPRHPYTAGVAYNLADAYRSNKDLERAIQLARYCVALSKAMLGPSHPQTRGSMQGLLTIYRDFRERLSPEDRARALCIGRMTITRTMMTPQIDPEDARNDIAYDYLWVAEFLMSAQPPRNEAARPFLRRAEVMSDLLELKADDIVREQIDATVPTRLGGDPDYIPMVERQAVWPEGDAPLDSQELTALLDRRCGPIDWDALIPDVGTWDYFARPDPEGDILERVPALLEELRLEP